MLGQLGFNRRLLRRGFAVVLIGDDACACVHVSAIQATLIEGRRYHAARKPFTKADDEVARSVCQFADRCDASQQVIQSIELLVDGALQGGKPCLIQQLASCIDMAVSQSCTKRESSSLITTTRRGCGCQQLIGDLRHCRDNYDGAKTLLPAPFNDSRSPVHRLGVFHRGTAKLHHNKLFPCNAQASTA